MNNEQFIINTLVDIQGHVSVMNREMGEVVAQVSVLMKAMWLITGAMVALVAELVTRKIVEKRNGKK